MELENLNNSDDKQTVKIAEKDGQQHVFLNIGVSDANCRHVRLNPSEARALAYALLSYAEQITH